MFIMFITFRFHFYSFGFSFSLHLNGIPQEKPSKHHHRIERFISRGNDVFAWDEKTVATAIAQFDLVCKCCVGLMVEPIQGTSARGPAAREASFG